MDYILRRWIFCLLTVLLLHLAVACGEESVTRQPLWEDIELEMFDSLPPSNRVELGTFAVLPEIDYWELRLANISDTPTRFTDPVEESVEVIRSSGTKCDGAGNKEACEQALLELAARTMGGLGGMCYSPVECTSKYIASTAGDVVRTWETRDELLRFLNRIDTQEEAIYWLSGRFSWDSQNKAFGAIRKLNDEYEAIATRGSQTCGKLERFLVRIQPNGDIRVLRSHVAIEHREPNKRNCATY